MAQKSWKIKLRLGDRSAGERLTDTLARWNEGVRETCLVLRRLRNGRYGQSGKAIWKHLSRRTTDYHVIYWITAEPKPTGTSEDVQRKLELTATYRAEHGLHLGLRRTRVMLGPLWKQAIHAAVQRIKGYDALLQQWHTDHDAWIEERRQWERDNALYMNTRPLIDQFNREFGVTRGRWDRWHHWLAFLQRPEIVKWKDEDAALVPPTDEEIREARRDQRRAIVRERKMLFAKNPQLDQFNRLHREYERRFARTGRRRHHDGFRHPPTFTLPALPNRPDWPRFQHAEGWRNLNLAAGTIDLYLPDADGRGHWLTVPFVPDARFRRMRPLPKPVKDGRKEVYTYVWVNRFGQPTLAQPQGLKLICRNGACFAAISISLRPVPTPLPVSQTRLNKVNRSGPYALKVIRKEQPDLPLFTCAIDLAIRHLGAATVAREGEVFARRLLHHRFFLPCGDRSRAINIPTLKQLEQARRALSRARSKSGGVRRGDRDFRRLRQRYRNLKDDRIKKSIAAIFQFALHHGAHVVVFEDLESLRPDAALDRGINRAMQRWNRGAMIALAMQLAEDYGLRAVTVAAGYTSLICSRCMSLGLRFDQGERRHSHPDPQLPPDRTVVRLARLGHWFYCPDCDRRVHADLNASENLHKVFLGRWPVRPAKGGCAVAGRVMLYSEVEAGATKALGAVAGSG